MKVLLNTSPKSANPRTSPARLPHSPAPSRCSPREDAFCDSVSRRTGLRPKERRARRAVRERSGSAVRDRQSRRSGRLGKVDPSILQKERHKRYSETPTMKINIYQWQWKLTNAYSRSGSLQGLWGLNELRVLGFSSSSTEHRGSIRCSHTSFPHVIHVPVCRHPPKRPSGACWIHPRGVVTSHSRSLQDATHPIASKRERSGTPKGAPIEELFTTSRRHHRSRPPGEFGVRGT